MSQSIETAKLRSMPPLSPAIIALAASLLLMAIQLVKGVGVISWGGDNDNMMRLVQVRDLLNGQSWFDLHQYRMGPEGGFVMHWSRLIDAPIAGLIMLFSWLSGSREMGETLALTIWPILLLGFATYFLVRATRTVAGDEAMLPSALLSVVTLLAIGKFNAGSIDHHNVQFILTIAALTFLLEMRETPRQAIWAGVASGLSIGIGMETAPYVAAAGIAVAIWLLVSGRRAAPSAIRYGLGFATSVAAVFIATVPSASWGAPVCDAISLPHLTLAGIGGLGLAAAGLLSLKASSLASRTAILVLVGAAAAATLLVFFPQCLAGPYSNLDPRQQAWIQDVREAQPLWAIMFEKPTLAAGLFCTPFMALVLCFLALRKPELRYHYAFLSAFMLLAVVSAVWQIRGGAFALGLSVVPLAAWLASLRIRASKGAPGAVAAMALAYVLSVNFTWVAIASGVTKWTGSAPTAAASSLDTSCTEDDYKVLANFPKTTVLSIINGGVPILLYTDQRTLAGPYHRNIGALMAQEIWHAPSDKAYELVRQNRIGLVAACVNEKGRKEVADYDPAGLFARLQHGDIPGWLRPAPGAETTPVRVYQVVGG